MNNITKYTSATLAALLLGACSTVDNTSGKTTEPAPKTGTSKGTETAPKKAPTNTVAMSIKKTPFGKVGTEQADLYTLTNDSGAICKISNYGCIVTDIQVPDKDGKNGPVTLGFDSLDKYLAGHPFFGCIAGRYANRIAEGKFSIGENEYTLATNNGANHLHGGVKGFDKYIWDAQEVRGANFVGLILTRTSPDGEEGYPGNLVSSVTYKWTNDNALEIDYMAKTDKATPINLTNHCYFNLTGGNESILDHEITLVAKNFVPTDDGGIPTGKIDPVANTPFDFTSPHKIGERIGAEHQQITNGKGYDHTWVLDNQDGGKALAAKVTEASTGRVLEVLTDQKGIQFYTGNYLDGSLTGRGGNVYKHRYGFCLETQVYPDSPNQKSFPKAILNPGETYTHHCTYKFSVVK
jgi:aldose 1-epimerase